ncbi:MAG: LysR family transcriptional regulator [Saccharospirillum sp.]
MRVFTTVVELGTYAAAARLLGLSKAMASKHVMHLEQRMGARLLHRNSRHLSLTEAGKLYFERCQLMLEELDEVEASISRATVNPRGVIRLTAPNWLANARFTDLLQRFRERYPEVTFDIDISGRFIDIVEEGFDLALRASRSLSPNLIARPLMKMPFVMVATPAYLARQGTPQHPRELAQHHGLIYSLADPRQGISLSNMNEGEGYELIPVMQSNSEALLAAAAVSNMGITLMPLNAVRPHLEDGTLVEVLPDHRPPPGQLYAVYTSRRYLTAKVRALIDFLSEEMEAEAPCD